MDSTSCKIMNTIDEEVVSEHRYKYRKKNIFPIDIWDFDCVQMTGEAKWQKDAADQNFDYMFKLLIIGNSSVGKTR